VAGEVVGVKRVVADEQGVRLEEQPQPAPQEGRDLVRVRLAALGVSDAAALPRAGARTPGRSVVGVRERDGARVVVSPDRACGDCERCRGGLAAHCQVRRTMGEPDEPGALSETLTVPARELVEVPDHVPDESAALAHFTAIGLQAAGRLHVREKPYATVIGAGAETVLIAMALALESATARVLSSSGVTLAACEKRGIRSRPLAEAGRRADQDVVIVGPGEPKALAAALEMAAPRGRVVLTPGARAEGADLTLIADREFDVLGARWAPVREGLAAIAEGRLDPAGLLERRTKLDRAGEALALLARGEALAIGVDPA
jgi:L-iditol 2-dehydrogenase